MISDRAQERAGAAALLATDLHDYLGGSQAQVREEQGSESPAFLQVSCGGSPAMYVLGVFMLSQTFRFFFPLQYSPWGSPLVTDFTLTFAGVVWSAHSLFGIKGSECMGSSSLL